MAPAMDQIATNLLSNPEWHTTQGLFYFMYLEIWAQFCCKMWGGQLGVKPI